MFVKPLIVSLALLAPSVAHAHEPDWTLLTLDQKTGAVISALPGYLDEATCNAAREANTRCVDTWKVARHKKRYRAEFKAIHDEIARQIVQAIFGRN